MESAPQTHRNTGTKLTQATAPSKAMKKIYSWLNSQRKVFSPPWTQVKSWMTKSRTS